MNSSVSPTEPDVKVTTNTARSASYLDLLLEIDSEAVLTTDAAFGYSVLFSIVGMVIGTLLAAVIYKVLLITGRLSFVVLDATHELHVKIKLYTVSVITTLLVCMIIAAIVVVAECGTECSGYTVGTSAAFIVPGIVIFILVVCLSVYLFVRCCNKDKDGVKKMEEDHPPDDIVHHGGKSGRVIITPSAIDVGTPGHYTRNQLFVESDNFVSSEDLRTTRTFSERSEASVDIKIYGPYIDKSKNSKDKPKDVFKKRINSERSEPEVELKTERVNIDKPRQTLNQPKDLQNMDSSVTSMASSKSDTLKTIPDKLSNKKMEDSGYNSKNPPDSNKSTSSINSNKVTPYKDKSTEDIKQHSNQNVIVNLGRNEKELHEDNNSSISVESIKEYICQDTEKSPQENRIWSISGSKIVSSPTFSGHVTNYTSNDHSNVMVKPDDQSSYIISVPTGDGLEEVQSSDSSSSSNEDETITVQTPADQSTDKKTSKKKRVKKKKWRKKKKTFVFPEQSENVEKTKTELKKPSKKKTKKKKKIII